MKKFSICFVINSVSRGKKILYKYPKAYKTDAVYSVSQEGNASKPDTPETLIESVLENTKMRKFPKEICIIISGMCWANIL